MAIAYHTHTFSVPTADAADLLAGTEGGKVITPDVLGPVTAAGKALLSAANVAAQRAALDLEPGTDVQAYDADLTALAGLDKSDGNFIVGNGTTFTAENGATARASLGLTIGTDVQAYDADLAAIAALAKTDGNFIVGNGTTWVAENGRTAQLSLGLNTTEVETIAEGEATDLSAWDYVIVTRYSAGAQVTNQPYEKSATDPGHSGAWQDSVGTWFEYVPGLAGIDVRAFGAVGDGFEGTAGAITSGDNTFTDSAASFTSADVGKTIHIGGAGAAGVTLRTTIASYTNATTVEVTGAAGTTVTGAEWCYGTDDTTAIKAATDYAAAQDNGGVVDFAPGKYLTTGLITSTTQERVKLRGAGGGRSVILVRRDPAAAPSNAPTIIWNGGAGTGIALTATAAQKDFTLTLDSTTGLAKGDYLALEDTSQRIVDNLAGTNTTWIGEVVRVRSVDSGAQITVWSGLENDYTTSATVSKLTLRKGNGVEGITLRNPIKGGSGLAARGIYLGYTKDTTLRDVRLEGLDDQGIIAVHNIDLEIEAPRFKDLSKDLTENGGAGYGIKLSYGNWGVLVTNAMSEKCRHLVTMGSGSGMENAHIMFADCIGRENYGAVYDTHPGGGRHITFENCHAYGPIENPLDYPPGFQIRSRLTKVVNPTCANVGVGVYFNTADDQTLVGGTFTDVDQVFWVRGARRVQILGSIRVVRARENIGVVANNSSSIGTMPGFVLDADMWITGDTTGAAFDFSGIWEDNYIINRARIHAPDITTFSDSVPHWALYGGTSIDGETKFESFPRILCQSGAQNTLASGQISVTAINLTKGERLTKMACQTAAAPTNQTNFWMALYDKDNNLIEVTDDKTTTAPNGTVPTYFTLADAVVPEYSGLYYAAIVQVADTPSTMRGYTGVTALYSATPRLAFRADSSLTDPASAPATMTFSANLTQIAWVSVG
jgi:hypothetical protein